MTRPTLIEVAKLAEVSAITVSRALRTPDKVSESLRKKVNDAVAKLGYVPNLAASTLAQSRSNAVVVMIPSLSNHVFMDVLRGIEDSLQGSDLVMHIGRTYYDPEVEEKALRSFLNPTPQGVILSERVHTQSSQRMLVNLDVPVVHIMDAGLSPEDLSIGFSQQEAAIQAVEHLLDEGFKRIGFLGSQMDSRAQRRLQGFRKAVGKAGGDPECVALTKSPSSIALGAELFSSLLAKFPRCDAIFCNNDDLAIGALFECQRRGLRVPQDMGICGFHDLGQTSESFPRITSISTPLYEIGQAAGRIVLEGAPQPSHQLPEFKVKVSVRESTKGGPS